MQPCRSNRDLDKRLGFFIANHSPSGPQPVQTPKLDLPPAEMSYQDQQQVKQPCPPPPPIPQPCPPPVQCPQPCPPPVQCPQPCPPPVQCPQPCPPPAQNPQPCSPTCPEPPVPWQQQE
ncbi:small proline-rich protein 2E-like [Ornithorhynchus anatinus]|uniref:small proline-rich protein 2E-like n=1 Tax=Ornithorhynchus anatinus TaxID=9258 RepID=UPI0019D4380D|nr:small proline-rich protein 2E-like [Ornithorhynchus anatinus]